MVGLNQVIQTGSIDPRQSWCTKLQRDGKAYSTWRFVFVEADTPVLADCPTCWIGIRWKHTEVDDLCTMLREAMKSACFSLDLGYDHCYPLHDSPFWLIKCDYREKNDESEFISVQHSQPVLFHKWAPIPVVTQKRRKAVKTIERI